MAGRAKIQFNEAGGDEFWRLYVQVSELRLTRVQAEAEKAKREHPDLIIEAPGKPLAAGPLVLALMREELARLKINPGDRHE